VGRTLAAARTRLPQSNRQMSHGRPPSTLAPKVLVLPVRRPRVQASAFIFKFQCQMECSAAQRIILGRVYINLHLILLEKHLDLR
jgi:hypothetical protein